MFFNFDTTDYSLMAASYLLGSVPFGLIVSKFSGKGDLRNKGSGNIGATNMMRVGGKKLGALVLLLDALKGYAAVMLAKEFGSQATVFIAAALAVTGHIFPIWLKFNGGKGVSTTFGVLFAVYWPIGLFTVFVWVSIFLLTKISSLAAILAMLATPTFAFYFASELGHPVVYLCLFLSVIVVVAHQSNIRRLIRGEEGRVL